MLKEGTWFPRGLQQGASAGSSLTPWGEAAKGQSPPRRVFGNEAGHHQIHDAWLMQMSLKTMSFPIPKPLASLA